MGREGEVSGTRGGGEWDERGRWEGREGEVSGKRGEVSGTGGGGEWDKRGKRGGGEWDERGR